MTKGITAEEAKQAKKEARKRDKEEKAEFEQEVLSLIPALKEKLRKEVFERIERCKEEGDTVISETDKDGMFGHTTAKSIAQIRAYQQIMVELRKPPHSFTVREDKKKVILPNFTDYHYECREYSWTISW